MKLRRVLASSSQLCSSALRGSIGPTPLPLIFQLSSVRSSWVASQPSIRKLCGCSTPIMEDEFNGVDNSMDGKGAIHPGKPVSSSSLVKPKLEGNWKIAKIIDRYPCAKGLWTIKLQSDDVLRGFTKPGQFIQLKKGESRPCYFAIASAPRCSYLELLVKEKESTRHIIEESEGSDLEISPVIGKGFLIEDEFLGHTYETCPVRNIVILCTGSGIAPIKSLIESKMLEWNTCDERPVSVSIYYGCATPDEMAYVDMLHQWKTKHSIAIIPTMSEVGEKEGWTGRTGFVQDVLVHDGVNEPWNTGGLLVGQKDMVRHGKAILQDMGISAHRILTNS